jgi:hypothetical protein
MYVLFYRLLSSGFSGCSTFRASPTSIFILMNMLACEIAIERIDDENIAACVPFFVFTPMFLLHTKGLLVPLLCILMPLILSELLPRLKSG